MITIITKLVPQSPLMEIVDKINILITTSNEDKPFLDSFRNTDKTIVINDLIDLKKAYQVKTTGLYSLKLNSENGTIKIIINSKNNEEYKILTPKKKKKSIFLSSGDKLTFESDNVIDRDTLNIQLTDTLLSVLIKYKDDLIKSNELSEEVKKMYKEQEETLNTLYELEKKYQSGIDALNHSQKDIQSLYGQINKVVTSEEKEKWNNKAEKSDIKTRLSELTDDNTHRLVTDEEKEKWGEVENVKEKLKDIKKELVETINNRYKYLKVQCNLKIGSNLTIEHNDKKQEITISEKKQIIDLDEYGEYKFTYTVEGEIISETLLVDESKIYTINANYDLFDSPGAKILKAGTMKQGYFGVVKDGLPSGDKLASLCGITQGTSQFSNEGYLKFALDGKILFKAKKTFRHSISWDHINSKGCVTGKTIEFDGHKYKVRLMKGHGPNRSEKNKDGYYESSGKNCYGSEWNKLMLPIHVEAKDRSWYKKENVNNSEVPNDWGINFTDKDLQTHSDAGNGSYQWCQETAYSSSCRLCRGSFGVSCADNNSSGLTNSDRGWAPVLEVLE